MKIIKSKLFLTFITIILLLGIFLMLMPKPIDMDLDKIGNGKVSVVFIYDPNLVVSNQQTTEINKAREIVGEEINFLVARQGDPTSEAFRMKHQANSRDLLFFNGNGDFTERQEALVSARLLIEIASGN